MTASRSGPDAAPTFMFDLVPVLKSNGTHTFCLFGPQNIFPELSGTIKMFSGACGSGLCGVLLSSGFGHLSHGDHFCSVLVAEAVRPAGL